jgi:hypothetical protein
MPGNPGGPGNPFGSPGHSTARREASEGPAGTRHPTVILALGRRHLTALHRHSTVIAGPRHRHPTVISPRHRHSTEKNRPRRPAMAASHRHPTVNFDSRLSLRERTEQTAT